MTVLINDITKSPVPFGLVPDDYQLIHAAPNKITPAKIATPTTATIILANFIVFSKVVRLRCLLGRDRFESRHQYAVG